MGTLQTYLQENELSGYSSGEIGWITGLYTALTLFLGLQTGPIVDRYSPNIIAPISCLLMPPMFFILGECTKYWHFILCLGVLGGMGGAISSTLALSITGKLFTRLRGLAIGVGLAGSAVGGMLYPFMLRELLPAWGFAWTMRCLGAVVAVCMILGTLCFRPFERMYELHLLSQRTSRSKGEKGSSSDTSNATDSEDDSPPEKTAGSAFINFSAFRNPTFVVITITYFILEFVIFGVSGVLPTFSLLAGNANETGFNLIAIISGVSCVGRIVSGFVGDRIGHCNLLFLNTVVTAGLVAATLLPFGTTHAGALYAFAVIWGMSAGCTSVLVSTCLGKMCEPKDYGRYYGTMHFVSGFSLLITVPLGGQMLETLGGTAISGLYVGCLALSAGGLFIMRAQLAGSWLDWKVKV